jgi:hypothetical protein
MMTDLSRLEVKVDILTVAINKLVLVEERQSVQALSITSLTARITILEQKLDMWINRGVGVWALAATLFTLYKAFVPI